MAIGVANGALTWQVLRNEAVHGSLQSNRRAKMAGATFLSARGGRALTGMRLTGGDTKRVFLCTRGVDCPVAWRRRRHASPRRRLPSGMCVTAWGTCVTLRHAAEAQALLHLVMDPAAWHDLRGR